MFEDEEIPPISDTRLRVEANDGLDVMKPSGAGLQAITVEIAPSSICIGTEYEKG
jgi:hypothetical protein